MRSRMFRDDLDRVVDDMEDSAIMFLGIDHGAHVSNAFQDLPVIELTISHRDTMQSILRTK